MPHMTVETLSFSVVAAATGNLVVRDTPRNTDPGYNASGKSEATLVQLETESRDLSAISKAQSGSLGDLSQGSGSESTPGASVVRRGA